MADIFQFPTIAERIYKNIEDVVEDRIRTLNHSPELAERVRNVAKDAVKEHCTPLDFNVSFKVSTCDKEDVKEIKRVIHETAEMCMMRFKDMAIEIIKTKIEFCEYVYAVEQKRKKLRLCKLQQNRSLGHL